MRAWSSRCRHWGTSRYWSTPRTTFEQRLGEGDFDAAFIALHGRGGEDDTVQSLCEQLGLPYTGTRSGPCGAAFHKARAKRLLSLCGRQAYTR